MLKKKNRLTTEEFDEVFKKGQKKFSKNFILLKLKKEGNFKISTTISKKIYKKAVKRNKTRRIMYEILRENIEKIPENFWGVLIITKLILEVEKEELKKEIFWLLNKSEKNKK